MLKILDSHAYKNYILENNRNLVDTRSRSFNLVFGTAVSVQEMQHLERKKISINSNVILFT